MGYKRVYCHATIIKIKTNIFGRGLKQVSRIKFATIGNNLGNIFPILNY